MPKIAYIQKNFRNVTLGIIEMTNSIIDSYQAQGFDLTLRQTYYQLISHYYDELPDSWIDPQTGSKNNDKSYDKLGSIINDARLAGFIDWDAIVDRTRNLESLSHWGSPSHIIRSAKQSYSLNKWSNQEYRPECWIEKDALRGVIAGICEELDVPHFSCRGYSSQSEMWQTSQRMISHQDNGQRPYIIHLGDHDPSGMDMTNDIIKRLEMFTYGAESDRFTVSRIALNHSQVLEYSLPPNPTKLTDSRTAGYVDRFGEECWELDALEPNVIVDLIRDEILSIRDDNAYEEILERQGVEMEELDMVSTRYHEVVRYLNNGDY